MFGLLTKPLILFLLPQPKHFTSASTVSDLGSPKSFILPLLDGQDYEVNNDDTTDRNLIHPNSLRMLLNAPTHTVHYYWRKFDNAFMRPVFGGRGFVPYVPGSPTEQSNHTLS